ncbi:hypothetical protein ACFFNX_49915, partial [Actinoallomurus acaciae]
RALPLVLTGLAALAGIVTWSAWPASHHRPATVPSPSAAVRHPSSTPAKATPRPAAKRFQPPARRGNHAGHGPGRHGRHPGHGKGGH